MHDVGFGAHEFNPSVASARFRPIIAQDGDVVPTIYGAADIETAICESVFHAVPPSGANRGVARKKIVTLVLSAVMPLRALHLADLTDDKALDAVKASRDELILSDPRHCPATVPWAKAIHGHGADRFDGIVWRARLNEPELAVMLWGDRVDRRGELETDQSFPPEGVSTSLQ